MNPMQKTTAADMARKKDIMLFSGNPADVPVSFVYDGKQYHGFSAEMNPQIKKQTVDSNIRLVIVTGRLDGLEIRAEYMEYSDFPVTEWVAFFTNVSGENSKILSDAGISGVITGENGTLEYSNGDTGGNDGYDYFRTDLAEPFEFRPGERGTPCTGASPYLRYLFSDGGVNVTIGWSGRWKARFEKTAGGIQGFFTQNRFHMYLKPGETMRTPRMLFEAYAGDENHGRNLWRRFYFKHWCPKAADGNMLPARMFAHVMESDGHAEFTGATEENQLGGIRDYIAKGLKPDGWWIDAGWYPCDYNWGLVGDWRPDPKRFPRGLTPIGEECEKNDMALLLWFEPERVEAGTWLFENHPEWILQSDNCSPLLNLGDPDALNWLINRVDSIIKDSHVTIYRQDFNTAPELVWNHNETPDRLGALENLHIQGYYQYWDALVERNPGLLIDSCSSGGHRNDPETMRRAVSLHYTDVDYGVHPVKQKQHRMMFEWMPYFRAHTLSADNQNGDYYAEGAGRPCDEFAFQAALVPNITCMVKHDGPQSEFDMAKRLVPIWRRAAELMTVCDYYPLTACRRNPEDYYAMEFYSPEEHKGFFQVLANTHVKAPTFTAALTLDDDRDYKLENSNTGEVTVVSGKALAAGYEVALEPRSAAVYFFEAVQG